MSSARLCLHGRGHHLRRHRRAVPGAGPGAGRLAAGQGPAKGARVEIKILDDQGKEVALGEAGEIAIKGPQVMQGYWQRPDETALVMTADGFFKSGDVGVMDAKGYIKIVDRKKDMIVVSGFKVFPNEIEGVVTAW